MPSRDQLWDVIVVGAGPAGLSAALILGRCRRRVLVLDSNRPRNHASRAVHGFLTRDGIPPRELRRLAREQLAPYDTVRLAQLEVTRALPIASGFQIVLGDGTRRRSRKLLLATGVIDETPDLEGFDEFYGKSLFHCPYCDGWESRDRAIAVYGRGKNVVGLAIKLTAWSRDLVVCTDGERLSSRHLALLDAHGIGARPQRIARLEGRRGQLERVIFADGEALARDVMFFSTRQRQASDLAAQLGCAFTRKGAVATGEYELTDVPGVFVAGDASRLVQLAIVAASEGAQAAFAINTQLTDEDRAAPSASRRVTDRGAQRERLNADRPTKKA